VIYDAGFEIKGIAATTKNFRPYIPTPNESWVTSSTPREHSDIRLKSEKAQSLFSGWRDKMVEPYLGLTVEGRAQHGLFTLGPEGAQIDAMTMQPARSWRSRLRTNIPACVSIWPQSIGEIGRTPNYMSKYTGCAWTTRLHQFSKL
jgi:hypothetical protein